ncbi:MAG: hypothetical protein KGI27_02870 [Thaumarchaeota archaeon]|nr:hypothetical protein [Nitrososphaerota archaeon]
MKSFSACQSPTLLSLYQNLKIVAKSWCVLSSDRVIPEMLQYGFMMKYVAAVMILFPFSIYSAYAEPAVPGTVLTFYVTDENLVTDHRGVMTLSTAGLVDFTIDGTPISGPGDMVETGIDTGMFQLQVTLPSSVDGRPLQDGDVVLMTYHQRADYSGNPQTITQSVVLSSIPLTPVEPAEQSTNIGRYFTLQLYAPNYNLDSQTPDDIPLNLVEVHMGGVSTTLADPAFKIGTGVLRETGDNTDTFAATFKIPKEIDGFPVEIGSTLEFTFGDNSQQIPSESSIYLRIGTHYASSAPAAPSAPALRNITVKTTNMIGTNVYFDNSTILQGYVNPICYPSSGSFFLVGTTTVACSATNPQGNSALKSFSVTVNYERASKIPSWVKNLAGFWCNGNIQDGDFKAAIKFLDSSKIISVPTLQDQSVSVDKPAICSWSDGKISDDQVAGLFYPLIR